MANIAEYLRRILSARLGEEVRGSIHDSIKAMNDQIENDLGGMIEDGNDVIEAMQDEIQSVETMKANGDLNMKPEDLTEQQWAALKSDLTNYYKRYESIYTTTVANETDIPINIPQYNTLTILEVYIEGRMLNRNEYTVNGTNSITLTTPLSEIGTKVHFIVYKSVCVTNEDYNLLKGEPGDSGALIFDTVSSMKTDETLVAGNTCQTLGYYAINDGGEALYKIVDDDTLQDDGGSVLALENGLKATLIVTDNIVRVSQFGAHFDGTTDDSDAWQKALNYCKSKKLKEVSGLRKHSAISKTIIIPAYITVNTMWLTTMPNSEFTNNYMVFFNTTNGTSWTTPYNDLTASILKNINLLNNNASNTVHGIYCFGNVTIENLYTGRLNRTFLANTAYIDSIKLNKIDISRKTGNNYAVEMGYLGDANYVDTIHIHDTIANATNNVFRSGSGKNPCLVKNIINGHVLIEGGIVQLEGFHGESNSSITCQDGNFTLKNIYIHSNNDTRIAISKSHVTLDNCLVKYKHYVNETNTDIDIKLSNTSTIKLINCYKDILQSGNVNRHIRSAIKTNISDLNNMYKRNVDGIISNETKINIGSRSNIYSGGTYEYGLNYPQKSGIGKWFLETGTYYYAGYQLYDTDRLIGMGHKQTASQNLTQGGDCFTFANCMPNRAYRIFRGTTPDQYTHYVDVVIYDDVIIDNGIMCNGNLWKEREAGDVDGFYNFIELGYRGTKVIVNGPVGIPTIGTWRKGDIVLNSTLTAGGVYGWICVEGGTPGTWKALGNIAA